LGICQDYWHRCVGKVICSNSSRRRSISAFTNRISFSLRIDAPGRPWDAPNRGLVPELVVRHWWQTPLHNQRAQLVKVLLLLRGNQRIIVINIPWYL
jgi:hypothetical protein